MNASQIVEAVLFASDAPLTADEIARADSQLDEDIVETALQQLQAEYDDAQRSFHLTEMAEGYQILTRSEFAPYLERFDNVPRSTRLSGPSLETLAIIAYRQPLGRLEIEYIRGVGASGVIRTLQERDLIDIVGRAEGLGRPLLYGTTTHFLEHFGFRSLEDLPRPEELPIILRDRAPLGPEAGEDEAEEDAEEDAQGALALSATEAPVAVSGGGDDVQPEGADVVRPEGAGDVAPEEAEGREEASEDDEVVEAEASADEGSLGAEPEEDHLESSSDSSV